MASMFNELYDMYILGKIIPRIPRPSPESLNTVIDQWAETESESGA